MQCNLYKGEATVRRLSDCTLTFGDAVSKWHCVVPNAGMAVNSELHWIWKGVAVT
jgi:hypothetical protein